MHENERHLNMTINENERQETGILQQERKREEERRKVMRV
jgi:hypothetical protein